MIYSIPRRIHKIMKTLRFISPVLLAAAFLVGGCASSPKPATASTKPYPLSTCVVSGDQLGAMGENCVFVYEGQEIKLCCKDCKKDFDKNPAKYLSQLSAK